MPRDRSFRISCPLVVALAAGSAIAGPGDPPADEDILKLTEREHEVFVQPEDDPGNDLQGDNFDSENMTCLAWLPLNAFPGNHNSGNDIWGYVSPSGREYAIMGLEKGYAFVEVTDPSNPVIVDSVTGPTSLWHDVKVIGEYAYGVSEGGAGIQVMDLSDIDNGNVDLVRNKTHQGHSSTHNIVANPDSGFLYLVGANIQNGGLVAVSTATPDDPTIVGAWNDMYIHDAQVVSYDSGPYAGREIAFCLSGFNGGWSQTGLRIVDCTDKNNMFTMATISWSGARYAHQGWLSEDRQHFYINDELDEGDSVNVTTTRVFDVSNLTNPSFEGSFTTGKAATDHNLYTHNGLIFESNYRSGLRVFDASNPTEPTEIAYFDTYPGNDGSGYNGAWSNYPYLPSGTIIVSDIERGLFVLRLDGINLNWIDAPTELEAGVPTTVTLRVDDSFGSYEDDSVMLNYIVNDDGFFQTVMSSAGNDIYQADLPASSCYDTIDYFATAMTTSGNMVTSDTVGAVVGTREIIVSDDFQTNQGWTVENVDLDTGAWVRAVPANGGSRGDPGSDYDGSGRCYVSGNGTDEDIDGGPTRLISPAYDLSANPDAIISYARWFTNDDGDIDRLDVHVSNNNGSSWSLVESVGTSSGWQVASFTVADYVNPTSTVRVRFSATDNPNDSVTEAAIDAFEISVFTCEDCPGDFNGDGEVNTLDVIAFLNAYTAGDASADFNGDGDVNTLDVLAFLNAWTAGC